MPYLRRYRAVAGALVALLMIVIVVLPPHATGQPSAQLPWRDKSTPFGMVTSIGNRVRADEVDIYAGLLREAGVQWAREEISWDRVQREPGGDRKSVV